MRRAPSCSSALRARPGGRVRRRRCGERRPDPGSRRRARTQGAASTTSSEAVDRGDCDGGRAGRCARSDAGDRRTCPTSRRQRARREPARRASTQLQSSAVTACRRSDAADADPDAGDRPTETDHRADDRDRARPTDRRPTPPATTTDTTATGDRRRRHRRRHDRHRRRSGDHDRPAPTPAARPGRRQP